MKCDNCGEQVKITPDKSISFCSSCRSKIAINSSMTVIDSSKSAFQYIVVNFGTDVLLGSKLVTIFADITRNQLTDEKELIKILLDKGALDCLKEAMLKPVSEQETSIKRAMSKLPKFLQDSDETSTMLRNFAIALGWQLPIPQIITSQPTVQKQQTVATLQSHVATSPNQNTTNENIREMSEVGSIRKFDGIDWRVLAVENNKALLISEKAVEKRPYNIKQKDVTWESCTLRKYLNGDFLNKLSKAKIAIAKTNNDNIFLLSLEEVCRYFGDSTAKLRNKGWRLDISDKHNAARVVLDSSGEACWWWLGVSGYGNGYSARVLSNGSICVGNVTVNSVSAAGGVRPALWLNL